MSRDPIAATHPLLDPVSDARSWAIWSDAALAHGTLLLLGITRWEHAADLLAHFDDPASDVYREAHRFDGDDVDDTWVIALHPFRSAAASEPVLLSHLHALLRHQRHAADPGGDWYPEESTLPDEGPLDTPQQPFRVWPDSADLDHQLGSTPRRPATLSVDEAADRLARIGQAWAETRFAIACDALLPASTGRGPKRWLGTTGELDLAAEDRMYIAGHGSLDHPLEEALITLGHGPSIDAYEHRIRARLIGWQLLPAWVDTRATDPLMELAGSRNALADATGCSTWPDIITALTASIPGPARRCPSPMLHEHHQVR